MPAKLSVSVSKVKNLVGVNTQNPLSIGVARIFDWRGSNHQSRAMTSSESFEREIFC